MVQDYLVYTGKADPNSLRHGGSAGIQAQFSGQSGTTSTSASIDNLQDLPNMVGGC